MSEIKNDLTKNTDLKCRNINQRMIYLSLSEVDLAL
jgi:hypothetical protein